MYACCGDHQSLTLSLILILNRSVLPDDREINLFISEDNTIVGSRSRLVVDDDEQRILICSILSKSKGPSLIILLKLSLAVCPRLFLDIATIQVQTSWPGR